MTNGKWDVRSRLSAERNKLSLHVHNPWWRCTTVKVSGGQSLFNHRILWLSPPFTRQSPGWRASCSPAPRPGHRSPPSAPAQTGLETSKLKKGNFVYSDNSIKHIFIELIMSWSTHVECILLLFSVPKTSSYLAWNQFVPHLERFLYPWFDKRWKVQLVSTVSISSKVDHRGLDQDEGKL